MRPWEIGGSALSQHDSSITLIAQVGFAEASHKMDSAHQILRTKSFQGPHHIVYLGDVAQAFLLQLPNSHRPLFSQAPGFNEQSWEFSTTSSDLTLTIRSSSYWGFGLFQSGYLNLVTVNGPYDSIATLIFDSLATLSHHPWEMKHPRAFLKWCQKNSIHLDLKSNEQQWISLRSHGQSTQKIVIDEREDHALNLRSQLPLELQADFESNIRHEIDFARKAWLEENSPGMFRALSRLEAIVIEAHQSIQNGEDGDEMSTVLPYHDSNDIPLIDLTNGTNEEE